MPRGPKGEIGNAVHVMRIATGEITEAEESPAAALGRRGGLKGGKARAAKMTPDQRRAAAKKTVEARWRKSRNNA